MISTRRQMLAAVAAALAMVPTGAAAGPLLRGPRLPVRAADLKVYFYRGGHVVRARRLEPGSRTAIAIDASLSHRGWMPSLISYAPTILIRDGDDRFEINVGGGLLVVNDYTGRRPWQSVRRLGKDEERSLLESLEDESGTSITVP
ncbi:hypothetical protein [Aquisphaera insulae]|uniref:hypothetical protein n=1 Tax=Aquisphaera insulae TaxID=2712864 RepID=UPI0013EDDAE3|nr:hypothetical protein [Aquisphaera insulae]